MKAAVTTAVVGLTAAWLLAACVGQLQFDPQAGGNNNRPPAGGTGGAAAVALPGTGGTVVVDDAGAPDTAPLQASCPAGFDVVTAVFKDKCGGCHGAAAPTKNLDLVTTGIGARTVG